MATFRFMLPSSICCLSQRRRGPFQKATLTGTAEYMIDNPKAVEQLVIGGYYYVDFTPLGARGRHLSFRRPDARTGRAGGGRNGAQVAQRRLR
jgi:hypothetical protein